MKGSMDSCGEKREGRTKKEKKGKKNRNKWKKWSCRKNHRGKVNIFLEYYSVIHSILLQTILGYDIGWSLVNCILLISQFFCSSYILFRHFRPKYDPILNILGLIYWITISNQQVTRVLDPSCKALCMCVCVCVSMKLLELQFHTKF
jgi:hypothetical protein